MRNLTLFALVIWCLPLFSQDMLPKCSQHVLQREYFEQHPEELQQWQEERRQLELHTHDYVTTRASQERGFVYHIPVVFHILHDQGEENISNAQVLDALAIMNRDFRKRNADTADVATPFIGMPADIEVEFVLAHRKPDGSCFSGITRTRTSATYSGEMMDQVNAVRNVHGDFVGYKYLNIFVVQNANGAAGYTTYPNNGWTSNGMRNGIWIKHDYCGSFGTSSVLRSRALTHEAGHWFNLAHCWGSTNDPGVACGSDNVADTPETIGWTTCTVTGMTCDSVVDNVENYMEYAYCSKMFTPGQKDRMRAALVSSMGGRNNIWTAQNLAEVGVQDSLLFCSADFQVDRNMICVGETVEFSDLSFGTGHDLFWSFSGGSPATADTSHPSVTYMAPGRYDVNLIAYDSLNSFAANKTDYIWVVPDTGLPLTYHQGFENLTTLDQSEWYVENTDGDQTWEIGPYGKWGGNAVWINNHQVQGTSRRDELILATVNADIPDTAGLVMSFEYSYRRKDGSDADQIKVSVSSDCGQSWTPRWVRTGPSIDSRVSSSEHYPEPWDFEQVVIYNITSQHFVPNLMVKFELFSNGGGNLFLDNINIFNDDVTSLGTMDEQLEQMVLYPNPNKGQAEILNLPPGEKVLSLRDLRGRVVRTWTTDGARAQLDLSSEPKGVYVLEVNAAGATRRLRVVRD